MPKDKPSFSNGLYLASGIAAGIAGSYILAVICYEMFASVGLAPSNVVVFDALLPLPKPFDLLIGAALYIWAARVLFKMSSGEGLKNEESENRFAGKVADIVSQKEEFDYKRMRLAMERDVSWLFNCVQTVVAAVPDDPHSLAMCVSNGLGMGIVGIDPSYYAFTRANLADKKFLDGWSERISADRAKVEAITKIWKSALHGTRLEYDGLSVTFAELGRDLGVDEMLSSYASGVPVEYVVAK